MIVFIYSNVDAQSYVPPDRVFDVDHLFVQHVILQNVVRLLTLEFHTYDFSSGAT